jgi:hypothetical protein
MLPKRLLCLSRRQTSVLAIIACGLAWLVWCTPLAAQPPRVATAPTAPFRALARGVKITIPPDRNENDTFSKHDIVEILRGIPGLDWTPQLSPGTHTLRDMATGTVFRHNVWCLEFTFKPVRMLWVDVPQRNGRMQRKLIWYMVYHVRNTGGHLVPARQPDGTYQVQKADHDVRFFPTFKLESPEFQTSYLDRVIPVAIRAVEQKEDPNRTLLDSVEVSSKRIGLSTDLVDRSVWGVATWEDVDPRVDYFTVSIEGLTNAYRWVDPPDGFQPNDPPTQGRVLLQKNLVLNFWRPGDEYVEDQRAIRYGIPGQVDYRWEYR